MPLFVLVGQDGPDGSERRGPNRAGHLEHLDRLDAEGRIAFAGPLKSADGAGSVGAIIMIEAPSLEEARATFEADPFVKGGVFENYTVSPIKKVYPKQS